VLTISMRIEVEALCEFELRTWLSWRN
jgi:hypothetical protein